MTDLGWIYACGTLLASAGLPLAVALFLAGLGGSLTHCASMCGTFVIAQTTTLEGRAGLSHLLLPYHAGRLTTYAALGAVVGYGFHLVSASPFFTVARHLLLALVAVIFLAVFAEQVLGRFGLRLPVFPGLAPRCTVKAMGQVRAVRSPLARFGLGAALGFLPCPMVFAALMAVAAHANPVTGALSMAAFALGTTPVLMGLGVMGARFLSSNPRARKAISLAAFGINGVVLLALAFG